MFLGDRDWAQVVKTNHYLPHHYLTLERVRREKRVSAQAKPISEVVKDFEQSLENASAFHETGLCGRRQGGDQSRSLGALAVPFGYRTSGLARKNRSPKRKHESRLSWISSGGKPKNSVSGEDSAALQNWVIQRLAKQMRSEKNPSITTRQAGLIAALLACLERAPGPTGPTAALPQILPMGSVTTPFPRTQWRPRAGQPCATLCGDSTSPAPPNSIGLITPEKIRAAFLCGDRL